jgi:hypothetical protein
LEGTGRGATSKQQGYIDEPVPMYDLDGHLPPLPAVGNGFNHSRAASTSRHAHSHSHAHERVSRVRPQMELTWHPPPSAMTAAPYHNSRTRMYTSNMGDFAAPGRNTSSLSPPVNKSAGRQQRRAGHRTLSTPESMPTSTRPRLHDRRLEIDDSDAHDAHSLSPEFARVSWREVGEV